MIRHFLKGKLSKSALFYCLKGVDEILVAYFKALVDNRKKEIQAIIQDTTLFQHLANHENMNLLYQ